jgi:uncharacterized protein YegL
MTQPPRGIDALPVQPAKSRLLITLVVDTSLSMKEAGRINELNTALQNWRAELTANDHVRRHGEIALVTFGRDHVVAVDLAGRGASDSNEPYVPVTEFNPPVLEAGGVTPMIEGLQYAFELLAARRQHLRASGRPLVNRPLVYLITDGVPTDQNGAQSNRWRDFAPVIRQQETGKHLLFFAFGVDGAQQEVLRGLAPSSWRFLANLKLSDVLTMVSTSIESAAAASAHDEPAEKIYARVNDRLDKETRIREFLEGNG